MLEVKIELANYIIETSRGNTVEECINIVENLDIESWNDDLQELAKHYPIYWTIYNKKGIEIANGTRQQLIGE